MIKQTASEMVNQSFQLFFIFHFTNCTDLNCLDNDYMHMTIELLFFALQFFLYLHSFCYLKDFIG